LAPVPARKFVSDWLLSAFDAVTDGKTAKVQEWRQYLSFAGEEQECVDEVLTRVMTKLEQEISETADNYLLRRFKELFLYTLHTERKFPLVLMPGGVSGSSSSSSRRSVARVPYICSKPESNLVLHCSLDGAEAKDFLTVLDRSFFWLEEDQCRVLDPSILALARTPALSGGDRPVTDSDLFPTSYRRWFTEPLPQYLIVILGRSDHQNGKLVRIDAKCTPALDLDVDKLVQGSARTPLVANSKSKHVYELRAAVAQIGTAEDGHFVCFRKTDGLWYAESSCSLLFPHCTCLLVRVLFVRRSLFVLRALL
jgi:hypothetical protein